MTEGDEGVIALGRMVRKGYSKKVTFKLAIRRSGGTAFQKKGIASAKTLRRE